MRGRVSCHTNTLKHANNSEFYKQENPFDSLPLLAGLVTSQFDNANESKGNRRLTQTPTLNPFNCRWHVDAANDVSQVRRGRVYKPLAACKPYKVANAREG